jgi:cold shock CspA family protein
MSINGKIKWFNATKDFAVGLAGTASLSDSSG